MQSSLDYFSSRAFTTKSGSDISDMRENTSAENSRSTKKAPLGVGPMFPRFSAQDVEDDALARIIDGARLAPTEWNLQTWRWIVVRNDGAKKSLEAATPINVPLSSAPVILICLADTLAWKAAPQYFQEMITSRRITEEEGREALRQVRDYYSSSPEIAKRTALANAFVAVHQILVGATESNLSSYWVTEFDEAKIKTHFHIPDHFLVAALLPIGFCEETSAPAVSKLPLRSLIYKEKFGETLSPSH
jgi:nitroreductase